MDMAVGNMPAAHGTEAAANGMAAIGMVTIGMVRTGVGAAMATPTTTAADYFGAFLFGGAGVSPGTMEALATTRMTPITPMPISGMPLFLTMIPLPARRRALSNNRRLMRMP